MEKYSAGKHSLYQWIFFRSPHSWTIFLCGCWVQFDMGTLWASCSCLPCPAGKTIRWSIPSCRTPWPFLYELPWIATISWLTPHYEFFYTICGSRFLWCPLLSQRSRPAYSVQCRSSSVKISSFLGYPRSISSVFLSTLSCAPRMLQLAGTSLGI